MHSSADDYEGCSPITLSRLGCWFKDTVVSLACDLDSILEDIPGSVRSISGDTHSPAPLVGIYGESELVLRSKGSSRECSEIIQLLSNDATYLEDPSKADTEDFEGYVYKKSDADLLMEQFPSLRLRMDHYRVLPGGGGELVLKRVLFKLDRVRWEALEDASMVIVPQPKAVLVQEGDDFVEWR